MQCSTTTAIGTAAGTLANLTAWTAATILFAVWLLPHYRHRWMPLFACSFGWAVWCFGCISNVIEWATSVHSTSILLPDTARFVAITHIDPRWIIAGACTTAVLITAVIMPIAWRTGRTFLVLWSTNQ